ncbi:Polyadenylation factor subunit 2 [Erysiphe necator]|uniref:Polyadenylation factor subunit 2 n=1 Tax=Uncinula necator TaxID=52586 RepID=A0A0B1P7U2_UNCNE|nr:Polyadenylation factor subunit 2 [Erysiphe necator]KHJ33420.1 putative wd repeat protein [Erysiphe necator]
MVFEQREFSNNAVGVGRDAGLDGIYIRGRGKRPITDYTSTMVCWLRNRQPGYKGGYQGELERPSFSFIIDMLPPLSRVCSPADAVPSRHLHTSLNKNKHPVNVVAWTPEGRRLLTGSSSGEFTLWNGTGFNFETIMQAHDVAIRALSYSHSDDWLLSADHDGLIKYWQPNFNNVKVIQGHGDAIRDLAFSPNDAKFVTASDDSTLKIFDFAGGAEESVLNGHGWDAKSVDWHPTKGLLVSGSKDHLVKLWDPRTGRCLTTLHGHKNTITKTIFEPVKGLCLATSARDQTARIFDLRMMRDILLLKGHEKEITTLIWHPIVSSLLSTGGGDGTIFHYLLDECNNVPGTLPTLAPYDSPDPSTAPTQTIYPAHKINHAHEFPVWSLHWHPLGHILASGSNDRSTKFWTRARPGEMDIAKDRFHIGEAAAEAQGTYDRRGSRRQRQEEEEQEIEDEIDGLVDQQMPLKVPGFPGIPGLPLPQTGIPQIPGMQSSKNSNNRGILTPLSTITNKNTPIPNLSVVNPDNRPDFSRLADMMQKVGMPPTVNTNNPQFSSRMLASPGMIPPPLPGFGMNNYSSLPGIDSSNFIHHGVAVGASTNNPPDSQYLDNVGNNSITNSSSGGSIRRKGPLPSQEESLQMEQRKGKYTRLR